MAEPSKQQTQAAQRDPAQAAAQDTEGLIAYLREFVTEHRRAKIRRVLAERTRYITVGLEDIYQPQNASAVLRTCDACGIQDVHIVENRNEYKLNPQVELGTAQWLTMHKYRAESYNTLRACDELRRRGYRIVATTPHRDDVPLEDFDLHRGPVALFYGNELDGLSEEFLEQADEFLRIPMVGFVESFNISVSAAITLYRLSTALRVSDIGWRLSEDTQRSLELEWLRRSIKRWQDLEQAYYEGSR
jgi:tRNA (guanosine-2'-O-)-methyltransferase